MAENLYVDPSMVPKFNVLFLHRRIQLLCY